MKASHGRSGERLRALGILLMIAFVSLAAYPASHPALASKASSIAARTLASFGSDAESDARRAVIWQDQIDAALHNGADPDRLAATLKRLREKGRPVEDADTLFIRAERLANAGLPIDPVLDRILQGLARGVAYERVRSVADSLEARLGRAARLVEHAYPAPEMEAPPQDRQELVAECASVLGQGVGEGDLREVLLLPNELASPLAEAVSPVVTLGFLASAGLPADLSARFVEAAWNEGYRGEKLIKVGEVGAGSDPAVADAVSQILDRMGVEGDSDEFRQWLESVQPASVLPLPPPAASTSTSGTSSQATPD